MAFSEETKQAAYKRAGGRCECRRLACTVHKTVHCGAGPLASGDWHAHHKTAVASGGSDALSNCEVLCIPCHKQTQTYGG
jgi:5-methylcytosine-specific restriction endonuclease McrA